ncbi:hypothetical protein N8J89_14260 [Crossiella sp. CA-258035]|uniref:hypothetical protein n=1 Tax=Crossiella sp. CA-258035 TaxID=2981138 RepID=UPI0024BCC257|nr:hypothetical protein [Crossiella sp. CA-258035]WHT22180.1 hypothetical protein N8J89_14260 [Crossiella sp. CA-258035]
MHRNTPDSAAVAAAGIATHAFNHLTVVVQDVWRFIAEPAAAGINPGTIYHPISAVLYVWLATVVYRGRNWGRIAITVLLGFQAVGRYFVFLAYPDLEVRADLVCGWALSAFVLVLLWGPARRHFAAAVRGAGGSALGQPAQQG